MKLELQDNSESIFNKRVYSDINKKNPNKFQEALSKQIQGLIK
jgi:hypothetical protein